MAWKLICLCAAGLCVAAEPQPATVDDLVRGAIENNREILALRQRVAEAQGLLRQAGVRLGPTLEFEGSTGRPMGTAGKEEYSVGYAYPIETGGKRDKRVQVARFSIALAEAELRDRIRELTLQVKSRCIDAIGDRRRVEALDRILTANRDSLRLMDIRVAEGDAAPLEQQLLAVDLNRADAQRAVFAGRAEAAALEIRALVGLAPGDRLRLADSFTGGATETAVEQLQQIALHSRSDLRIARVLEQQGGAELELAGAQGHPDVTLSARYAHRNERFDAYGLNSAGLPVPLRDRDNILSVGIALPLFTRSRNLGSIEAASARAAAARLRREHLERTIPLEVEAAWRRREAVRGALDLLDSSVLRQSERNLETVREAHTLGHLRMLDVLNEQRRVIETQLAYVDAAADLARAAAELEHAVGGGLQ